METLSEICRCELEMILTSADMLHLYISQWLYLGRNY